MTRILTACLALVLASNPARASDWPLEEVDKAIAVASAGREAIEECARSSGTKALYRAEQKDIDGDGINEVIVRSAPAELGNGATACYGQAGMSVYLTGKTAGNWVLLLAGDNAVDFDFQPRPEGGMPDVEVGGPGLCFPVFRHYHGAYRPWKVCDDNRPLFAEEAPWLKGDPSVVPRNFGEVATSAPKQMQSGKIAQSARQEADEQARMLVEYREIYDHNGSQTFVNAIDGVITYTEPKRAIAGTVKPGTVLFRASKPWDIYDAQAVIRGTAYVFKKGCAPAPYDVSGHHDGWHTLILKGAAPVREASGCKVIGYRMNGNSTLRFESLGD